MSTVMNIAILCALSVFVILGFCLLLCFVAQKLRRSFSVCPWLVAGFAVFTLLLFPAGATKPTLAPRHLLNATPVVVPMATDGDGYLMPTNCLSPTNLCFWLIAPETNAAVLGLAWPADRFPTNGLVDVFCSTQLTEEVWRRIARVDVGSAQSNVLTEVSLEALATNMPPAAFFCAFTLDDSDGDGISDALEELETGTDPYQADTDGDNMPDGWELESGCDPLVFGEELDSDHDGLPDRKEAELGTDPQDSDSDDDGIDDGDEFYAGTNPLNADTDGDGFSDGREFELGTCPTKYERYEVPDPPMLLQASPPVSLFDGEQENTQEPGPDYEMHGQYTVDVDYSGATTPEFSILGIHPPGGTTTLSADATSSWYGTGGPVSTNAFTLSATGASFKALKTGIYSFQAYVDDYVRLEVGQGDERIVATAAWGGTNPGTVAGGVLIAGHEYPVRVDANSIGGPAELSFRKWGEFTPILKPQLGTAFSKGAVIFEDAYVNVPGEPGRPRRSTQTEFRVGIRSGGLGGVLSVSTANANRLTLANGVDCLNFETTVGANVTNEWCGCYEAITPSLSTNDIVTIATFTENRTGKIIAVTNSITAIKVELTAVNTPPMENCDPHRHVYGVGEYVLYTNYPANASTSWHFTPADNSCQEVKIDEGKWSCPLELPDGIDSIFGSTIVEAAGATHQSCFMVVRPSVFAANPQVNIMTNMPGYAQCLFKAGFLTLHIDMYVAPLFVSFIGMDVREIPDESQSCPHSGYFDDRQKGGSWSHTAANGAGGWNRVNGEGYYATDVAAYKAELIEPWSYGWKSWVIPMEYGWSGVAYGRILPDPPTTQDYTLYENGTLKIKKFQYEAKRNIYNIITINGKVVSVWN